jgi:membrane glycosyltransferase
MNLPSLDKPWENAARMRRLLLLALIIATSVIASGHMADILPHRGSTRLEFAIVIVFATLFAWISIGFWEAMAGLFTLARRVDRFSITLGVEENQPLEGTGARTAILIPVANEEPERVFAGVKATYQSLEETGQIRHFDFFILSDSSDPDRWVEEETAWAETCRALGAFNRIFYRRRRVNLKRKSGNIADFCRRWGRNYRYMIVFDADSVMAGKTLVRMVLAMERHPKVGILPHPAVCQPRVQLHVCSRTSLYTARRLALLGAQCHYSGRSLHATLRAPGVAGKASTWRVHHEPRLRGSGLHPTGWMGSLARL